MSDDVLKECLDKPDLFVKKFKGEKVDLIDWKKIGFTDKNTILGDGWLFNPTKKFYGKSKIYKEADTWLYYYRDPAWVKPELHHNHLEVFNSKYEHIWEADPITGFIDKSKKDPTKSIRNIMK